MTARPAPIHKALWTGERIARLGFLIGLGWDAKRVSVDTIINSNPANVCRQAHRFGLAFRDAQAMSFDMSTEAHRRFGDAAAKRGLTREALSRLLLREIATDPNLIDNVLDDDMGEIAA